MKLENLKPNKGSIKKKKRIGRGQGSGKGGTSTRGHKGAKSRSGYSKKYGFEGGQMPLQKRIPKFGFKNINKKKYNYFNLFFIQKIYEKNKILDKINILTLKKLKLISNKKNVLVKILGKGKLKVKLDIYAHKFSKKAKETIERLGGKAILI